MNDLKLQFIKIRHIEPLGGMRGLDTLDLTNNPITNLIKEKFGAKKPDQIASALCEFNRDLKN